MTATYTYLGAEERVYSGYLTTSDDGAASTLIGTPGMPPVSVVRAAGNEEMPEVPGDGLWAPADAPKDQAADKPADQTAGQDKAAKTGKAAS